MIEKAGVRRMGIVVEREDGMEYVLPDALALDGSDLNLTTPGMELPRRHGQWRFDRDRTAGPRELRISGTFENVSRAACLAFAEELTSILFGGGDLRLRRRESSPFTIVCAPRSIEWYPHRGRFGARVFSLTAILEALDPWWYHPAVSVLHTTAASGEEWALTHPGSDERQPLTVRLYPASGTLVNPSVAVAAAPAGAAFSTATFTGSVDVNHVLVIDGAARKAYLEDWTGALIGGADSGPVSVQNVTNSMNASFQADGLFLHAGGNTLRYGDGATSSHQAQVHAEFVPRSW